MRASVFITTDSGPMHLAGLVDTPIVGLFFAETPILYGPLATNAIAVCPESYAIPSFTVYTGKESIVKGNVLAQSVTVQQVYDSVEQCLANSVRKVGRRAGGDF